MHLGVVSIGYVVLIRLHHFLNGTHPSSECHYQESAGRKLLDIQSSRYPRGYFTASAFPDTVGHEGPNHTECVQLYQHIYEIIMWRYKPLVF